ncbi:glucosamine-6-phosphate deaminase [Bacillus sp. Marseille-P3661]|uniref:glucosamine-6-phosphate deaminase n=1 Tax=Bacillus sp. Marseille-P3661 TaxID=1936234 RepID=UPI000C827E25|nr:glucosamine-6-phosphate deaminase [Bacillus sp. Marseille-P3661]
MKLIIANDYAAMSELACSFIAKKLDQLENPVFGLATGSTPEGLYKCLIEKFNQGKVTFKNITTFNLDEYVGLEKDNPNSYHTYMKEKFFKHIDISMDRVHLPNGVAANLQQECSDYEKLIQTAGHIDVQILGLGINGHIGFNEPGTPFSSRTHIVELDESTRQANARFFSSIEQVPVKAITMGIDTIMESKEILLIVSGEKKANALARLIKGETSENFPASILKKHKHVTIIADKSAASNLD